MRSLELRPCTWRNVSIFLVFLNPPGGEMLRATIPLDWEGLETAVERNSPDIESFLERGSGQVLTIIKGEPEAAHLSAKISANIEAYLRVEPASSREQYRWMERFVASVVDEPLRKRLLISIDGKGAFRRFKDVLLAYPTERERWFSYRSNLLHWHIQNWLASHEIVSSIAAPWGVVEEPEELAAADEEVGEAPVAAPGEAMRREARELVDSLAPMDLPSAISFLEFLKNKGVSVEDELPAALPTRPTIVR